MLQIPVALGGDAIAYNLPGVSQTIHLTREALVDIYLGKMLKWNDPQIAKLNPGMKLPDMPIVVVHRSDGSGTTYIFTDFLSHVSPEWKSKVGTGKSVTWPAPSAVGGKGNEGVAGQISNTPGAIGYVELAYVIENKMPASDAAERAGKWVACTPEGVARPRRRSRRSARRTSRSWTRRARSAIRSPATVGRRLQEPADKGRAKALHDVLSMARRTLGTVERESVDYVPLPDNMQNEASAALRQMQGKMHPSLSPSTSRDNARFAKRFDFTRYRSFRSG